MKLIYFFIILCITYSCTENISEKKAFLKIYHGDELIKVDSLTYYLKSYKDSTVFNYYLYKDKETRHSIEYEDSFVFEDEICTFIEKKEYIVNDKKITVKAYFYPYGEEILFSKEIGIIYFHAYGRNNNIFFIYNKESEMLIDKIKKDLPFKIIPPPPPPSF